MVDGNPSHYALTMRGAVLSNYMAVKKLHLEKLLEFTREQENLLKLPELDDESFSVLVDKKDGMLKKLDEFDSGFQSIYNRVSEALSEDRECYKEQILAMQELITAITDLGVKLTALEQKNRAAMELKLREKKQGIRQFKVSKKTADTYYKNMMGMQTGASYFMDKKK